MQTVYFTHGRKATRYDTAAGTVACQVVQMKSYTSSNKLRNLQNFVRFRCIIKATTRVEESFRSSLLVFFYGFLDEKNYQMLARKMALREKLQRGAAVFLTKKIKLIYCFI